MICEYYNKEDNRCELAQKDLETWAPNFCDCTGNGTIIGEDGEERMIGGFQIYTICFDDIEGCELLRNHPILTKRALGRTRFQKNETNIAQCAVKLC